MSALCMQNTVLERRIVLPQSGAWHSFSWQIFEGTNHYTIALHMTYVQVQSKYQVLGCDVVETDMYLPLPGRAPAEESVI